MHFPGVKSGDRVSPYQSVAAGISLTVPSSARPIGVALGPCRRSRLWPAALAIDNPPDIFPNNAIFSSLDSEFQADLGTAGTLPMSTPVLPPETAPGGSTRPPSARGCGPCSGSSSSASPCWRQRLLPLQRHGADLVPGDDPADVLLHADGCAPPGPRASCSSCRSCLRLRAPGDLVEAAQQGEPSATACLLAVAGWSLWSRA